LAFAGQRGNNRWLFLSIGISAACWRRRELGLHSSSLSAVVGFQLDRLFLAQQRAAL